MDAPDIFEHMDYREYLREFYEVRKKAHGYFSYRYMAGRIGVDPGYLVKVLQGRKHFAVDCLPGVCALAGLEGARKDYLFELLEFAKMTGESQIRASFSRLMELKGQGTRTLEEHQAEFYRHWYHNAIRSLLGLVDIADGQWSKLAHMLTPPIRAAEAQSSVELLQRIGLIARAENGFWRPAERFVSSGKALPVTQIRRFQKDAMRLASESLERHPREKRDISTVTIALSQAQFPALAERVREFRQEILRMAQSETDANAVYQLNIQLFPLAFDPGAGNDLP